MLWNRCSFISVLDHSSSSSDHRWCVRAVNRGSTQLLCIKTFRTSGQQLLGLQTTTTSLTSEAPQSAPPPIGATMRRFPENVFKMVPTTHWFLLKLIYDLLTSSVCVCVCVFSDADDLQICDLLLPLHTSIFLTCLKLRGRGEERREGG